MERDFSFPLPALPGVTASGFGAVGASVPRDRFTYGFCGSVCSCDMYVCVCVSPRSVFCLSTVLNDPQSADLSHGRDAVTSATLPRPPRSYLIQPTEHQTSLTSLPITNVFDLGPFSHDDPKWGGGEKFRWPLTVHARGNACLV